MENHHLGLLSEPIQTLSPEWLNPEKRDFKKRVEGSRALTKSKTSPENHAVQHKPEKEENVFDKEFPSLGPTKKNSGRSSENSVWSQEKPAVEAIVKNVEESYPTPSQTIRTSRSSEDFQLEFIKGTPKGTNKKVSVKVELLATDSKNRKESTAPTQDIKMKKKPVLMNSVNFRKVVSEPNLPLDDPKFLAVRNRVYSDSQSKAPQDKHSRLTNRNSFFEDLMRTEQQLHQDKGVAGNQKEDSEDLVGDSNKTSASMHCNYPPMEAISLVNINPEDEERVLRSMGWRPEEEDHIPELTEEEIIEIKQKLSQRK